jgi:hypothetical protein
MKIVILTAMHGRQGTVKYCFDKMPNIEKIVMYSEDADGIFLDSFTNVHKFKTPNRPLSNKWNEGVKKLKSFDFDAVILLGSDDYVDEAFINYVSLNIANYELIAFKDIYFESNNSIYYWKGYVGERKGEPAGAGKVYTKSFLNRINYNLFPVPINKSLDGLSWGVCIKAKAKKLITTLKSKGLYCCDVKDGQGMTKIEGIPNLKLISKIKIVVGMATFAGREQAVERAINSLINQVDEIVLYDNEVNPNLYDNGKFYGLKLQRKPCYYFTCDDDLIYPPNYVQTMIVAIEKHKTIVTHHGRIVDSLDVSYYRSHKTFRCLNYNTVECLIDVPGTGVTAFRTDYFNPKQLYKAKDVKMSDIVFGLEAKKQGKKITILRHPSNWIRQIQIDNSKSIHTTEYKREQRQIELTNKIIRLK